MTLLDAVVVGSGPNGLAAAVTLARAGLSVRVLEAQPTIGGGSRTLPGLAGRPELLHDVCSAVHPMAWSSPFLRAFDLAARGVELRTPDISYAQPLDGGRAGLAYHDLDRTVEALGPDGPAWRSLVGPLTAGWEHVAAVALGDRRTIMGMTGTTGVPMGARTTSGPGLLGTLGAVLGAAGPGLRFGGGLLEQGTALWGRRFSGDVAPALLTGVAAHSIAPLPSLAAAGTALLLAALAHGPGGWPLPVGGSGAIVAALVQDLLEHGGEVETDREVRTARDLPPARTYFFDTAPGAVARIMGTRLSPRARAAFGRFRHGNAAAKVDFALSGPVPWAVPDVGRAGTVHVGGSRPQLAAAEREVARGRHAEQPVVLVSDPVVTDPGRAAGGLRPLWTYAHVPAGSDVDMTEAVTAQLERFAPGFRDVVVSARCVPASRMPLHDANYVGGDIAAGAVTMARMLASPAGGWEPYFGGAEGVYLCSASAPPGPGVHGMGGWHAARRALRREFDVRRSPSLAP
ncbi:phytoene desaturase family protein [Antribacter gilvus]|uniref:phytoene desaturase family protein n=1 Tax=Antribacter gilvus TaxID=2304675 RepID=UPI000F786D52|nr:NAD(P)/FAD-dependent oxidoreductase [Antribacter gilvus]